MLGLELTEHTGTVSIRLGLGLFAGSSALFANLALETAESLAAELLNPFPRVVSAMQEIDFERLYKVLILSAEGAVRYGPETFNMGYSSQDVVHETFSAFLSSPNRMGWDPAKGSIERFLASIVWKRVRSHLRRDRKVGGSLDDPGTVHARVTSTDATTTELEFEQLRNRIYEAIGNDMDLRALVAATEHTSGAHNVNQELAYILNKSVQQVVNLKRRLLKNREVVTLLWPPRKN